MDPLGNVLAEAEQAVCLALLQLRKKGEDAKQVCVIKCVNLIYLT
jgi:hypothetical protein